MQIIQATSQEHFFDCMMIRGQVFVDEQHVPSAIEIDHEDRTCRHYLLYINKQPIATLRLIEYTDHIHVGRVATLKPYRHQGYATKLLQYIETLDFVKSKGILMLGAQKQAVDFYIKLGYEIYGEPFYEAGIEHVHARKFI